MKFALPETVEERQRLTKTLLSIPGLDRVHVSVDLYGWHNPQNWNWYVDQCIIQNILPNSAVTLRYSYRNSAFVPKHVSMFNHCLWDKSRVRDLDALLLRGGRIGHFALSNQEYDGRYMKEILPLMDEKLNVLFSQGYEPSNVSIDLEVPYEDYHQRRDFHGGVSMSLEPAGLYVNTNREEINTALNKWVKEQGFERVI